MSGHPGPRGPFDVWAPHAQAVDLVLTGSAPGAVHGAERPEDRWAGARTVPMERAGAPGTPDGGWWTPQDPVTGDSSPGYGYRVDGAGPFPDPRSRWQPDTVHGPSRRVDPEDFAWTDAGWAGRGLRGAVLYELHVGTFTRGGTLDSAIDRLGHLVDLGVSHVELLPVNAFAGSRNWGYDGVGWYAVDAAYGGPEAYRRFVDACHAAGLAVVQDVVYNHLGPAGNYLPQFGPYLTEAATGWGSGLNLDGPDSDEVRRYVLDNARMWFEEYHVDGLRLDAVHALTDTRATHLLEELAAQTDSLADRLGRPLVLIAESDRNDPRFITARAEPGQDGTGGHGLAGQWSDDFHHAVHVALTGETSGYYADFADPSALPAVLTDGFFHAGTYSSFRGRHHGRPLGAQVPAEALVVSTQNHDQVGNRATGDRLSATLDEPRLAIAAALLLTGPNTPMLFMGQEWAATTPWQFFTDHRDPELGRAVTEGRRREFARMDWAGQVPDPQDEQTFARSVLDWSEPESDVESGPGTASRHARILELYRRLTRIRREHPVLTDPDRATTRATLDAERRWLRMDRGVSGPGPGQIVLLAALGRRGDAVAGPEPMPVPTELAGYRVLAEAPAGVGRRGIPGRPEVPEAVPAPGFLLLARD